ncbi:hypothetical protein BL250_06180 [Erwinia sp. OLTSP20]|uniref:DUF481 domain-containing protein n=1 Tax=unclassified Erwinia TaxID=2622719 RepID=UPI000C199814|nr:MULTISPECIES: DUF481 domain-containing protein [unclassified Erwinia]PIJ51852.1 hypothetical protein BV501_02655 [Erwinia sp. OAMSP11]PIJ74440.1 hypothetical protein BK416_04585 [Erwinia sp. OLSSP12]PIJ83727.1 hypothetical protein BLD47_03540 [Erwinia sp. OLCASP19]PIJ86770.1 hypothetical protein BLD46_02035 [Erwinia sp. OLMTSP26]PIJ88177.1 hypothetical protein BLD49_02715 [Erwinia sp. OLMDSP33]
MKTLNKLSAILLLSAGFVSHQALADNAVFTVMDDPSTAKKPFDGDIAAGYLAQSGNTRSSSATASANATWYQPSTAYSLWGNAANTSSNDERSSETYALGGRSRYNVNDFDYLFGQVSWLSDRFNGYDGRTVAAIGYGRQILNGPVHSLRAELGPGVRYDDYREGGHKTQALAYGALTYQWQLTDNTKFIQGVSVLGSDDTTVNSETGLQVALNEKFALKLAYNVTWNQHPPESAPDHTDTKTVLQLSYAM